MTIGHGLEAEMDYNENWVIEAQDISYTYDGNEEKALDELNLKIRKGSRVASDRTCWVSA